MNIGFDAKRAYHNGTGLGHYSRTLIRSLSHYYPQHQYYLFNPKASNLFQIPGNNLHEILPSGFLANLLPSAWRSSWVTSDLKKHCIDIYHGLSHEIPVGIKQTGIKSVVTIHDLIHERHPEQYNAIDVKIYAKKFRYACSYADKVIAISEQTKQDIIRYYNTPAEKIEVCYQSCNPAFREIISSAEKKRVKEVYDLPDEYFLYVGSVIERKNLLNICKALLLLPEEVTIPLVVIGGGGKYKQAVIDFIKANNLGNRVIFLSDTKAAQLPAFRSAADFPAIYQQAIAMIYPSFFEGFGIPVLEALCSRLPVITSNVSCLPEAGGNAAYYVDPSSAEEIAAGMRTIYFDKTMTAAMIERGLVHAEKFTEQLTAAAIMNVYEQL
jgi:glycosyltransferase involved in cell wall biosynthesis